MDEGEWLEANEADNWTDLVTQDGLKARKDALKHKLPGGGSATQEPRIQSEV